MVKKHGIRFKVCALAMAFTCGTLAGVITGSGNGGMSVAYASETHAQHSAYTQSGSMDCGDMEAVSTVVTDEL